VTKFAITLDETAIRVAVAHYLSASGWKAEPGDVSVLVEGQSRPGVEACVVLSDGPKRPGGSIRGTVG
jgi:hypothetical protein